MNLLIEHKSYIEFLKKEYFSKSWEEAINCRTECISPKIKNLIFAFNAQGIKKMIVMDTLNKLREEL